MLKSFIKAVWIVACFILPGIACAVGFGSANVSSALGQPFKAEIELVAVSKADRINLTARLASPEAFKTAGIDYPYNLSKLKFQIETRDNGELYIKVTSADVVNDPFVTLLVEVSWSSGKLMREYTFLLDPPDYKAEQPKAEEVKPIEPVIAAAPMVAAASAPEAAPSVLVEAASAPVAVPAVEAASAPVVTEPAAEVIPAPVTTAVSAPAAVEVVAEAASAPVSAPMAEAAPAPAAAETVAEAKQAEIERTVTVKRGDTLSKIAAQVQEPDVTLEQMLVALYRANANQFDGKNMNRLRTGKILRMPTQSSLEKLSQTEAVKEIRIQTNNWNAYRQKLAAASVAAPEEVPKQEVSGKISTSVADKTPATKESAKEVLKLSKGEAPGDKVATAGGAAQVVQDKHAKEEEAITKKKSAEETGKRVAMLEKNVQDMQHLVELKGQSAVAPAPASAVATASAVGAASAVRPAKPVAKPKMVPVAPAPPSLLDDLLANPIYLGGGAAALLALGGLGFFLVRRRGKGGEKKKPEQFIPEEQAEEVVSKTGSHVAVPPVPSPATGDFTQTLSGAPSAQATKAAEPEEVDAISEAELFLNFGRDAQAEEVLKDALSKDPANRPVQLKLLSVYANRKDLNGFTSIARQLKESGDAAAWEQAAALGRTVDPSNPMYGGAGAAAPAAGSGKAEEASSVDIDLGAAVPMDFDITAAGPSTTTPAMTDFDVTSHVAAAPPAMDFDVTGSQPQIVAASLEAPESLAALEGLTMDFDVTGSHPPAMPEEKTDFDVTGGQPVFAATPAMDFDVTGSHPNVVAQSESPALEGLMMDFDISSAPAAATPTPTPAAPVEAKASAPSFDLGALTFDVTSPPTLVGTEKLFNPAESLGGEPGLGAISLNLDESVSTLVSPVSEAGKDEHWHEVATKLDLAKAYYEMGDTEGAREILGEVVRDGDEQQRASAQSLMQQL